MFLHIPMHPSRLRVGVQDIPSMAANGRGMAETPLLSWLVGPPGHRAEFLPSLMSSSYCVTRIVESSVVWELGER